MSEDFINEELPQLLDTILSQLQTPIRISRVHSSIRIEAPRAPRRNRRNFMTRFNFNVDDIIPLSFGDELSKDQEELTDSVFFSMRDDWIKEQHIADSIIQLYGNIESNRYTSLRLKNYVLQFIEQAEQFGYKSFIDYIYSKRCNCGTLEGLNRNVLLKTIAQNVFLKGKVLTCYETQINTEYFTIHHRIPTDDEEYEYILRQREFNTSPEEFHQKDKQTIPTLCRNLLPVQEYKVKGQDEDICMICTEEFIEGNRQVVLKPCGHTFHYSAKECLGDKCIMDWMEKNNVCPMCKTKIEM